MDLTVKEIDAAKPKDKPYKLSDSGGLCLLVVPYGTKLWRLRYPKPKSFWQTTARVLSRRA